MLSRWAPLMKRLLAPGPVSRVLRAFERRAGAAAGAQLGERGRGSSAAVGVWRLGFAVAAMAIVAVIGFVASPPRNEVTPKGTPDVQAWVNRGGHARCGTALERCTRVTRFVSTSRRRASAT